MHFLCTYLPKLPFFFSSSSSSSQQFHKQLSTTVSLQLKNPLLKWLLFSPMNNTACNEFWKQTQIINGMKIDLVYQPHVKEISKYLMRAECKHFFGRQEFEKQSTKSHIDQFWFLNSFIAFRCKEFDKYLLLDQDTFLNQISIM